MGRAPRTKETLPDFLKWRRVTRPPLVFRGLTGSQRTPGFWGVTRTAHKILQFGFYWPTLFRDCAEWVKLCDRCQKIGNISSRNEMPLKGIMVVQIFDVWGIDFMGPFP